MRTKIEKVTGYKDDRGNTVLFDGDEVPGLKISFNGKDNVLKIHRNARPAGLTIDFDCNGAYCEVGENTFKGFIRLGENCRVVLGEGINCTGGCYISTAEGASVLVGSDVMIASNNEIRADDGHPIFDVANKKRINFPKDIIIGNHVWIGAHAKILGGSKVGDGSVIGLGSIVKGLIPNNCIAAGVPAKVVRRDVAWERPHLTLTQPYYKDDPSKISTTEYWNLTVAEESDGQVADKAGRLAVLLKILAKKIKGR